MDYASVTARIRTSDLTRDSRVKVPYLDMCPETILEE